MVLNHQTARNTTTIIIKYTWNLENKKGAHHRIRKCSYYHSHKASQHHPHKASHYRSHEASRHCSYKPTNKITYHHTSILTYIRLSSPSTKLNWPDTQSCLRAVNTPYHHHHHQELSLLQMDLAIDS
ncbi:hypothetical protein K440DRAFT_362668 [Wilcoxina mikolae CBS 423.85]|nr:hypothetical protein K440DRAFT_362668 [Wilcoxina mikolae CBS 423.85]